MHSQNQDQFFVGTNNGGFHPEKKFWGRSGCDSFTHRVPPPPLRCVFGYYVISSSALKLIIITDHLHRSAKT